jgi:hypothetical protein
MLALQTCRRSCLERKSGNGLLVSGRQDLYGDPLIEKLVVCCEHHPHPTLAEDLLDAVLAFDDLPRSRHPHLSRNYSLGGRLVHDEKSSALQQA